jgi:outer membrane protein assembly factor BamA
VRLSAGGSVLGYWRFVGSVGYRYGPGFGHAYSQVQQRPETTYLAFRDASGPGESLTVDITNWASGGVLGVRLAPSLSVAASAAYLQSTPEAEGTSDPVVAGVLNPATSTRYATVGGHLTLDRRDVQYNQDFGTRYIPLTDDLTDRPLNPDRGILLSLNYTRFRELDDPNASFSRVEVEAQQYASILNGYHTFALRHRSVFSDPDEGAAVPFYRLPYVGGNFTLRGYDEFRFQGGPHALLYNLEYRYKVWHHADMVLFGDAGKVFDQANQWGFTDLRYSYGTEVRFTTPRATLFRFGIAFDEDHEPRLVFKFSNIF